MLQQHGQDLERLLLKPNLSSIAASSPVRRSASKGGGSEADDTFCEVLAHLVHAPQRPTYTYVYESAEVSLKFPVALLSIHCDARALISSPEMSTRHAAGIEVPAA